jgi:hypothetical protein
MRSRGVEVPTRIVKLVDHALPGTHVLFGPQSVLSVSQELDAAFLKTEASLADPLKVTVSFEDLPDIGVLVLLRVIESVRQLYKENWPKYVMFTGLRPQTPLYSAASALLREYKLSIACEPFKDIFCGVTAIEMATKGSVYEKEDWPGMSQIIDYLFSQPNNRFLRGAEVLAVIKKAGFSDKPGRKILKYLEDEMGVLVARQARGVKGFEYIHVVKYDPPVGGPAV